jgi:glutamate-1-semialdehyde 2,1-aminomutase
MNRSKSQTAFIRAQKHIPGGVNSPARAFKAVGGNPIFIKSAKGAYIYDEDDNKYVELINSWGPMILGHANPIITEAVAKAIEGSLSFGAPTIREIQMAELIAEMVPSIEKVRMVNSGTEATMSAIRVARGFTGRDKILKFEGCYHGHGDSFLIAAGSGAITLGVPDSPGVTKGTAKDTIIARFNDLDAVQAAFDEHNGEFAALIVEPVAGNMGTVIPEPGFLEGLRSICTKYGTILIFDEVMTGFRLSKGGAQELLGVTPDMTTMGKIIGAGMPVGAYGGKAEIMDFVAPVGPVYQAGTLAGNPIAMASGYAMLNHLNTNPSVYDTINNATAQLAEGFDKIMVDSGIPYSINHIGSMITLFFTNEKVIDFESAKTADTALFGKFFNLMLDKGVYLAPSQFEALFISTAIGKSEVDLILKATSASINEIVYP